MRKNFIILLVLFVLFTLPVFASSKNIDFTQKLDLIKQIEKTQIQSDDNNMFSELQEISKEEMKEIKGERITDGVSPDSHGDKHSGNELYLNKVTHYYLYLKRRYNTLFMKYLVYLEAKHVSEKVIEKFKKELGELWEQMQLLREARRFTKEKMMEDPY